MLSSPNRIELDVADPGNPGTTTRTVCYEWGSKEVHETVLCVHGLTRNGRDFDFLARLLAADFRVLAPDMPGRGQSQWLADPTGYNYPNYVAQITSLIMQLGLSKLHWVGTSMGGIMGMMVANAWPGLIQSLVLNDIGAVVSAAGIQRIAMFANETIVFETRAEAQDAMRKRWAPFGIHAEEHWQHMFAHGLQEKNGKFYFAYDPGILAAYNKDRSDASVVPDLDLWGLWEAVTKIPVLLIRGTESDILSRETALAMQLRHPHLTYEEISGVGHAPALMEASQTTLIRDWLKSVTPA